MPPAHRHVKVAHLRHPGQMGLAVRDSITAGVGLLRQARRFRIAVQDHPGHFQAMLRVAATVRAVWLMAPSPARAHHQQRQLQPRRRSSTRKLAAVRGT